MINLISIDKQKHVENLIRSEKWEIVSPEEFRQSKKSNTFKNNYLLDYDDETMREMDLYKLFGYNIGFALKKRNDSSSEVRDEVVSVHNNEPDVRNIGKLIMKSALSRGGIYLAHFVVKDNDFLSKFYEELNYRVYRKEKIDLNYKGDNNIAYILGFDTEVHFRKYCSDSSFSKLIKTITKYNRG